METLIQDKREATVISVSLSLTACLILVLVYIATSSCDGLQFRQVS